MGDKIIKSEKSCPFKDENNCGEWCEWFIADGKGSGDCVIHKIMETLIDLPHYFAQLLQPK